MLIFGHRGASATEPENTIRSFKKAVEAGADAVELDLRQTQDGEVVAFHDWSLKRLFGVDKAVSRIMLAELKQISVNRPIPTLDEILASVSCDLNIELKVHGIEKIVLDKIKNFPHKVLISSSYPGVLKKVRALDGNIRLGLIIPIRKFYFLSAVMFLTRKLKLYSVNPRNFIVSEPIIKLLRQSVPKIYVWTVNSEKEYQRMINLGVDGIFTDYPELFKKI